MNNRAFYRLAPIASVPSLARFLGVEETELRKLAAAASSMYRGPIPVTKKGKTRFTFDAQPPLKRVHRLILERILDHVEFPDYLMGGIKDPSQARGYIRNAQRHARAKLLVGEDVTDYYPSITAQRVKNIYLHVFHFAPPVAALLTALCTKDGVVPQGAKTSTALANLALYRLEPEFRLKLGNRGIHYTRFVDDVHASTIRRLSRAERTRLVSGMRSLLLRSGFEPKRKKQFVASAGTQMTVHNLNVNTAASRDKVARKNLRMELHILEKRTEAREFGGDYQKILSRLGSKIGMLRQTNPSPAEGLRTEFLRLKKLRDKLSER